MNEIKEIWRQLMVAANRAYGRGIQTGSGGNVSARLGENRMLVKSSGGSLGDCSMESGFVITDFDGKLLEGTEQPTREAVLHGHIYKICPWVNGVVHTHSPYAIAWASRKKPLARVTWHSKLKICADIPTLDVPSAMVMPEHLPLIDAVFAQTPKVCAFLLVDHGIVALGKDPIDAEHNAELIEETAQVACWSGIVQKLGL